VRRKKRGASEALDHADALEPVQEEDQDRDVVAQPSARSVSTLVDTAAAAPEAAMRTPAQKGKASAPQSRAKRSAAKTVETKDAHEVEEPSAPLNSSQVAATAQAQPTEKPARSPIDFPPDSDDSEDAHAPVRERGRHSSVPSAGKAAPRASVGSKVQNSQQEDTDDEDDDAPAEVSFAAGKEASARLSEQEKLAAAQ
jgi:hypothetical protein